MGAMPQLTITRDVVLNVAENATNIQSLYEHVTTKLTIEEVATDLFYWKASTYLIIIPGMLK